MPTNIVPVSPTTYTPLTGHTSVQGVMGKVKIFAVDSKDVDGLSDELASEPGFDWVLENLKYDPESDKKKNASPEKSDAVNDGLQDGQVYAPQQRENKARPGIYLIGESLIGITTPLFAVVEKLDRHKVNELALCNSYGAAAHRLALEKERRPPSLTENLGVKCVWMDQRTKAMMDAFGDESINWDLHMLEAFMNKTSGHEPNLLEDTKSWRKWETDTNALLDQKTHATDAAKAEAKKLADKLQSVIPIPHRQQQRDLLFQVSSSLAAVAAVAEQTHSFILTELVIPKDFIGENKEEIVKVMRRWGDVCEHVPFMIFQHYIETDAAHLPLILYAPSKFVTGREDVISGALEEIFTSETIVLITYPVLVDKAEFGPTLLAALAKLVKLDELRSEKTKTQYKPKQNKDDTDVEKEGGKQEEKITPTPTVSVMCSFGSRGLSQMAQCAAKDLPLVVLEGSGRYANMWSDLWPQRTSRSIDDLMKAKMEGLSGNVLTGDELEDIRTVLGAEELHIHKMANNSGALETLLGAELQERDLLLHAAGIQRRVYIDTWWNDTMPQLFLICTSILITFVGTVLTIVAAVSGDVPSYALAIFPTLVVMFESAEGYLKTSATTAACWRAAGLVEKEMFMYLARVLKYSDTSVQEEADRDLISLSTVRKRRLEAELKKIRTAVHAAGVVLRTDLGILHNFKIGVRRFFGADEERLQKEEAERIEKKIKEQERRFQKLHLGKKKFSADDYVGLRMEKKRNEAEDKAHRMFWCGVLFEVTKYTSVAVGTVFAALGDNEWVAMTVAANIVLSRLSTLFRIEELRHAYTKVASTLQHEITRLDPLSQEPQKQFNEMVGKVEQVLETVLPGAPGHVM